MNTNKLSKAKAAATDKKYIAKRGIEVGETRYEVGAIVPTELIAQAAWLLEQGHVEEAQEVAE